MVYTTILCMDLCVKKEKIDEFKEKLKKIQNKKVSYEDVDKSDENAISYYYNDLHVYDDGEIGFDEYYRKMFYVDEFSSFLAPYVEEGYITCIDEDEYYIWRIVFDGKGNWEIQHGITVYEGKICLANEEVRTSTTGSYVFPKFLFE